MAWSAAPGLAARRIRALDAEKLDAEKLDAEKTATELEIDDDDAAIVILVSALGLVGRSMHVHGQLQTRLLGVGLSPLGFFASANLLDDERG